MKPLQSYINESINEAQTFPLVGALDTKRLIMYAAKFDVNKPDGKDWDGWYNVLVDPEWAEKHKPLVKKFCDLCKRIVACKDIEMFHQELNYYYSFTDTLDGGYEYDDLCSEIGVKGGDYHLYYCTDGDDGEFFNMVTSTPKGKKLIDEFVKMTHDPAGWDIETETIPTPEELGYKD